MTNKNLKKNNILCPKLMKKVYQLPITLGSFLLFVNIVIEIGRLSLKIISSFSLNINGCGDSDHEPFFHGLIARHLLSM